MAIRRKRCERCGSYFRPRKSHYRLCNSCFEDTRPIDTTHRSTRRNAPARKHGGVSRLHADGRRPLAIGGDERRNYILIGLRDFLSKLYGEATLLSDLLQDAGVSDGQLISMKGQPRHIDAFLQEFCPSLRSWLIETVGYKATSILIETYGLYGDERATVEQIAYNLGLGSGHVQNLERWSLRKLREDENVRQMHKIAKESLMKDRDKSV